MRKLGESNAPNTPGDQHLAKYAKQKSFHGGSFFSMLSLVEYTTSCIKKLI